MLKEAKIASLVPLFPAPQYVVVLEDVDKTRLVPIWIGIHEGNAIALEMQGEKFPRPLTHDLMVGFLKVLKAEIQKIIISDLRENSYYATIVIKSGEAIYEVDARPSDSLALAVRVKCPIYIDEKVLKKCPLIAGAITAAEIEKFKEALKTLTPEQFFKDLTETEPEFFPETGDEDESDEDEDPEAL